MGLFDAITGSASKKAAAQNSAAIQGAVANGGNALLSGSNAARNLLGVDQGGNALTALGQGYGQARQDLSGQYGRTQDYLGGLTSSYQPLVANGQNASNAYFDAIGANGADGSKRASSAFQAAPGYQYAMDQALEAVNRTAAARGGLAGGNTTADILKTATGLADQGYQQYVDNLKGGTGFYQSGLAGQAQGLAAQGQASQNQGNALGALGTGLGQGQAALFGKGADVQTGLGQGIANLQLGGAQAQVQNNNNLAQAQNQASGNFLGGLFGLGKTIAGGLGGSSLFGGGGWGGGR